MDKDLENILKGEGLTKSDTKPSTPPTGVKTEQRNKPVLGVRYETFTNNAENNPEESSKGRNSEH